MCVEKQETQTISVVDQRRLIEVTRMIMGFLTIEEYISIMDMYMNVINRVESEEEEHEVNTSK